MSYDVIIGDADLNYTYNVGQLFYDHIAKEYGRGGLFEIDGLTGKEAAAVLAKALDAIDASVLRDWRSTDVGEPVFCARYDAPNGWGSTLGAILFLARIMAACHANPRKKVRIC